MGRKEIKMKEFQINGVDYLFDEEAPMNYNRVSIGLFQGERWVVYIFSNHDVLHRVPLGEYKIIGKASALTEKDWQQIVESEFDTWLNYLEDEKLGSYYLTTAKESGYSLLELHGFKPERTLILKRKT